MYLGRFVVLSWEDHRLSNRSDGLQQFTPTIQSADKKNGSGTQMLHSRPDSIESTAGLVSPKPVRVTILKRVTEVTLVNPTVAHARVVILRRPLIGARVAEVITSTVPPIVPARLDAFVIAGIQCRLPQFIGAAIVSIAVPVAPTVALPVAILTTIIVAVTITIIVAVTISAILILIRIWILCLGCRAR